MSNWKNIQQQMPKGMPTGANFGPLGPIAAVAAVLGGAYTCLFNGRILMGKKKKKSFLHFPYL